MRWTIALATLTTIAACQPNPLAEGDLALVGVTVIDVTSGDTLRNRTIVVGGNRIIAMALDGELEVDDQIRVVDARGLYVMPGLWDAHVHSAANTEWHFPLLIAHGITAVRNLHTTVDTSLALTQTVKARLATGAILGPRFLANGGVVDGHPPVWPGSAVATTPADGRAIVDSLAAGGADFIKVYDRLREDVYDAVAARAGERGIPMDGHVPFDVSPVRAAAAGQRTIEHTSGIAMGCAANADSLRAAHREYLEEVSDMSFPQGEVAFFGMVRSALEARDPELCRATVDAYLEHGVTVTPTLVAFMGPEQAVTRPGRMAMIPPTIRGQWQDMASLGPHPANAVMEPVSEIADENLRMLYEAGVPFLAGTDLGNPFLVPGASLHDELQALVDVVGMNPLEALQAATIEPARVFGLADSLGTVASGMLADLVLLRSNPLEDIARTTDIAGVVLNGRYFPRDELDALIATAAGS